ncbi:MAG: cyclopropane-fatty-acyl-phospholipid synthase [Rhodobacteraceae bacterium]|nr:cyclopropane-fatty-acyl-phospholipid synthase [Paracoccaceae bacterium]
MQFPSGEVVVFGKDNTEPIKLRVINEKALKSLCLNPVLALGETYMDEGMTIEGDDLKGLGKLVFANIGDLQHSPVPRFINFFMKCIRTINQFNNQIRARKNIQHHYDLTDELYELFLDKDRQYSCAYFTSQENSLEQAQIDKKNHIAKKLLIEPGMDILDIGSGWGGLGLTLAKDHGARVKGVTLSTEQHKISNRRAREEGLSDRVDFSLMDYRAVKDKFDRIVSVGMFEHVGVPHYREYFSSIRSLLKEDGVALLHTIGRSSPPAGTNAWLSKYIFPGGYVPALSETMQAIEKEGLMVNDIEFLRLHYAETLAHWYMRFMSNIDRIRDIYDERFCRMWRYYLVMCEMSFRYGGLAVFQIQLSHKNDIVPITRDYLYK